jgi:transposase
MAGRQSSAGRTIVRAGRSHRSRLCVANAKRPHRALRYRLSFDHGWDIVDEYMLRRDTQGENSRAIALHFRETRGVSMSHKFVLTTLARWRESGDPTLLRAGGGTSRRASTAERKWMKKLLRSNPDMYFSEIRVAFIRQWRWSISNLMIAQALHFKGEGEDDKEMTLKVLETMARQRSDEARRRCREALCGPGALSQCYIIMDESSMDRRTLRRRRGWAPRGEPAKLFEMFEVNGSAKLQSLLAVVNKDGFVLEGCDLVEGGTIPHGASISVRLRIEVGCVARVLTAPLLACHCDNVSLWDR